MKNFLCCLRSTIHEIPTHWFWWIAAKKKKKKNQTEHISESIRNSKRKRKKPRQFDRDIFYVLCRLIVCLLRCGSMRICSISAILEWIKMISSSVYKLKVRSHIHSSLSHFYLPLFPVSLWPSCKRLKWSNWRLHVAIQLPPRSSLFLPLRVPEVFSDMTDTGNCAKKTSGTQDTPLSSLYWLSFPPLFPFIVLRVFFSFISFFRCFKVHFTLGRSRVCPPNLTGALRCFGLLTRYNNLCICNCSRA